MQDVMGGRGACYFDFHGEDARWLLDHIPKHRIEDVVYFDPLNPNFALGYNPLDGVYFWKIWTPARSGNWHASGPSVSAP